MIPYNSFEFNGINSLDNGVYISGNAVFNAPERDVEMIVIPGRNGEFIRDNGRFNNIEVTYPCGMFGDDDYAFRTKLRQFRNMLAGQTGYQRLVDTYNPDEYRLGVFKDAVEVEPAALNTAGQFEVVFNCKPQRFLTSGESTIEVEDGDSIENPTPFDAQPMIMTEGYGILKMNGQEIKIVNEQLGRVQIGKQMSYSNMPYAESDTTTNSVDINALEVGDSITINKYYGETTLATGVHYNQVTVTVGASSGGTASASKSQGPNNSTFINIGMDMGNLSFTYGTSSTQTASVTANITVSGSSSTKTVTYSVSYDGDDAFTFSMVATRTGTPPAVYSVLFKYDDVVGDSTQSTLGHPTYIDCELGEVYKIENGSLVSLNRLTDLGSNLPVLSPGENEITFDNTFTSVEIIPHWWVV